MLNTGEDLFEKGDLWSEIGTRWVLCTNRRQRRLPRREKNYVTQDKRTSWSSSINVFKVRVKLMSEWTTVVSNLMLIACLDVEIMER